jgi:hypothetical protein
VTCHPPEIVDKRYWVANFLARAHSTRRVENDFLVGCHPGGIGSRFRDMQQITSGMPTVIGTV